MGKQEFQGGCKEIDWNSRMGRSNSEIPGYVTIPWVYNRGYGLNMQLPNMCDCMTQTFRNVSMNRYSVPKHVRTETWIIYMCK